MIERSHRAEVRGGFTLMEMLVVVAIIVLLAAMAAPIVMGRLDQARIDRAKVDCRSIAEMVEMYQLKYGEPPANLEQLAQPGADGTRPFIEQRHLLDPWNRPYQYAPNGPHNSITGKPDVWTIDTRGQQIGNW
jgi:general secretion pathway protein G